MGYVTPSTFVDPRLSSLLRDRSAMPGSGVDLVTHRPEEDPYAGTTEGLPTYDTPIGKAVGDSLLMLGGDALARRRTAKSMLLGNRVSMGGAPAGTVPAVGGSGDVGSDQGTGADIVDPPRPTDNDPWNMQVWLNQVAANRQARQALEDRKLRLADEAYQRERRRKLDARNDVEYEAEAPLRENKVVVANRDLLRNRAALETAPDDIKREHDNAIALEKAKLDEAQQRVEEAKARIAHLNAQAGAENARGTYYGDMGKAAVTRANAAQTKAANPGQSSIKIGTRQAAGFGPEGEELFKVWDGTKWVLDDGAPAVGKSAIDKAIDDALGGVP